MRTIIEQPLLVLLLSLGLLWPSTFLGALLLRRNRAFDEEIDKHYALILGATLTLLSLIVGFSFSMAVGRYDQRKNLEEEEANAIGTEYLRVDQLSPAAATRIRALLKSYLEQRVIFYTSNDDKELRRSDARTAQLQNDLWAVVSPAVAERPTPPAALVLAGMNDVLNSQGYTQAAWRNRIPSSAWVLMFTMAVASCLLVGYGARSARRAALLLMVLPLVISLALYLVAEIDSPRTGLVRIAPLNLLSVADLLKVP